MNGKAKLQLLQYKGCCKIWNMTRIEYQKVILFVCIFVSLSSIFCKIKISLLKINPFFIKNGFWSELEQSKSYIELNSRKIERKSSRGERPIFVLCIVTCNIKSISLP